MSGRDLCSQASSEGEEEWAVGGGKRGSVSLNATDVSSSNCDRNVYPFHLRVCRHGLLRKKQGKERERENGRGGVSSV